MRCAERARLSAAGLIPLVWVPPLAVRELRALLAHRRRLVRTQTVLKNRLHSLLHRLHIAPPEGDPFCAKHRVWWDALQVSPTERLHVRHDLATLDQVAEQLSEIDDELRRLSCTEPWSEVTPYLLHLPGVGLIVAMTILAAIGDTLAPRLRAAQVQVSRASPPPKNSSATVGWPPACMIVGRRIARAYHQRRPQRTALRAGRSRLACGRDE
jgi:transposase